MFEYFLMFLALCSVGWASRRNDRPMPIEYLPADERRTRRHDLASMDNRP